jgi:arginine:ornithine antiporter / lysine permease
VYAYAKAGFGEYLGFFSAFGYWASACIGNVTYWVLISSTLGLLWPGVFGHGDTLAAVALGSAGLWISHFLITRGVQEAAVINKIVTVAKIVPIVTFVLVAFFALKAHVFSANFWGGEPRTASALFSQVRATMLVTVFVFLGIEPVLGPAQLATLGALAAIIVAAAAYARHRRASGSSRGGAVALGVAPERKMTDGLTRDE